jgi:hypothetical protein
MVEAFHNDGWWAGVVSAFSPAVPEDETSERPRRRVYRVCFPTTRELLEFEETALRPNRVFQGERWVPAAEAVRGIWLLTWEIKLLLVFPACIVWFSNYFLFTDFLF